MRKRRFIPGRFRASRARFRLCMTIPDGWDQRRDGIDAREAPDARKRGSTTRESPAAKRRRPKREEPGISRNSTASCRLALSVDNCSHLKSSHEDINMQVRLQSVSEKPDAHQLNIFDFEATANDRSEVAPGPEVDLGGQSAGRRVKAPAQAGKPITASPVRVVVISDLPTYPKELIEQVDRSIVALPSEKLWLPITTSGPASVSRGRRWRVE